jgi:hypothetical protein
MKSVLKTLAVAVVLAASQNALSQESPFPSYGEAIDRALPAFDTYADWHARNGTWMVGNSNSPFPSSAEPIDNALPPLDTYADRNARSGKVMASSGSPFPSSGEPIDRALPPLDTYADRYARQHGAPSSAEVDASKLAVSAGGRS